MSNEQCCRQKHVRVRITLLLALKPLFELHLNHICHTFVLHLHTLVIHVPVA